ncbi:MAG: WD40 repeat domain-containing protein [Candidatus Sigynarchaeum springense]
MNMKKIRSMTVCIVSLGFILGMGLIQSASADSIVIHYIGEGNIGYVSDSNDIAISGNGDVALTTKFGSTNAIHWTTLWKIPAVPVGAMTPTWNHSAGPFVYGYLYPSVSDDGHIMAVLENRPNGILQCFGNASATALWNYSSSTGFGVGVKVSSNGEFIAFATQGEVTLFHHDGGLVWQKIISSPQSICISGDGSVIAVGFSNGSIACFDNISSNPKWTSPVILAHSVTRIAISKDGSTIVAGCLENGPDVSAAVLDARTGTVLWKRACHYCIDVAISADGNRIFLTAWYLSFGAAMFARNSNATLWEIQTSAYGDSCDLSLDGKIAIFGGTKGNFYIVNGTSGHVFLNFTGPLAKRFNDCAISDTGKSIVALSETGAFFMFRLEFPAPLGSTGDPFDLIQWILIGGLAAGLVIVTVVMVKKGKGRKG